MVDERRYGKCPHALVSAEQLNTSSIADKKELLLRARYDNIATTGGKSAIKKAIEKRQKKIGQKEKKSRPFARERLPIGESSTFAKRAFSSAEGPFVNQPEKRRRVA